MLHTNNSWSSTSMIFKMETGHKLNVIRRPFYAPRKHEGNQNLLFFICHATKQPQKAIFMLDWCYSKDFLMSCVRIFNLLKAFTTTPEKEYSSPFHISLMNLNKSVVNCEYIKDSSHILKRCLRKLTSFVQ